MTGLRYDSITDPRIAHVFSRLDTLVGENNGESESSQDFLSTTELEALRSHPLFQFLLGARPYRALAEKLPDLATLLKDVDDIAQVQAGQTTDATPGLISPADRAALEKTPAFDNLLGQTQNTDQQNRRAALAPASQRSWQTMGPAPLQTTAKYDPQGLTFANGYLILSVEKNYEEPSIVYRIDPTTKEVVGEFAMPPGNPNDDDDNGAIHTSGLTWDGESLWAVDYRSLQAYQLDLEASFSLGQAVVKAQFPTGLDRPSAMASFTYEGKNIWRFQPLTSTG